MSTPRKIAGYGWKRDLPDPRDLTFKRPIGLGLLPATVDLEGTMPPVYDQGQLGSCTANAACALLEHQQMAQSEGATPSSRLFVYYEERRLEGSPVDQDTGAEVRTGIKVLVSEGAPTEADWPYDIAKFGVKPPDAAYQAATKREATEYRRVTIGHGAPMRSALALGLPIAFGFTVPDYFEQGWDPASTPLPLPGPGAQFIGGHAVVIVGYDFSLKHKTPVFKVRNSWGSSWGAKGHFWMDSRWFDPFRGLAADLWVVSKVTPKGSG
jgi:C1A family cysteine protease